MNNHLDEHSNKKVGRIGRTLKDLGSTLDVLTEGERVFSLIKELYPICRSITGNGVRQSLRILQEKIPLQLFEVPTGTQVFDWVVPKEWNIRDAYVKNAAGEKIVKFQDHSLHVLNYSVPVRHKISLAELRPHLYTLPENPDWIPYRTSYYQENWGFCLTYRQYESLRDETYEVFIDSTLEDGYLTYGEFRVPGSTNMEVLISCHSCHPSLCNDNLSGMATAARLAELLATVPLRYSYRFIWIPGTIGSITWLARNEKLLPVIKHGLVLSCVGDLGTFHYKRSRHGRAEIDRVVEHVLKNIDPSCHIDDFAPFGYDERQYCSPGINLPVGCLMRTPNGKFPEYHTSADDLSFIRPQALGQTLLSLLGIVSVLEENRSYVNLYPKGEPQLGRRGLYGQIGGSKESGTLQRAILWSLNFSDGSHSILDIAERSGMPFAAISSAMELLLANGLVEEIQPSQQ